MDGGGPGGAAGWRRVARPALQVLAAVIAWRVIVAYHGVGATSYDGWRVSQGYGMNYPLAEELAHLLVFSLVGAFVTVALVFAVRGTVITRAEAKLLRALAARPSISVILAFLLVAGAGLFVGVVVLGRAPVTDDESTYHFIGQTLRLGHVVAPSPGGPPEDLAFFQEQWVVLDEKGRYGKYPIGHPLLLAAGQALGAEELVVPLVSALVLLPLAFLAHALGGPRAAVLACILYASSPQVLLTAGTRLSQPASALAAVCAAAALLAAERAAGSRRKLVLLACAGLALGYGVLVRWLPGLLFALLGGSWILLAAWRGLRAGAFGRRAAVAQVVALAAPLALMVGIALLVNRIQAGSALRTGYQQFHQVGEGVLAARTMFTVADAPLIVASLATAVARLGVWLFGSPASLFLAPFAARTRGAALLWGFVAGDVVYRIITAKAGVATTGPQYVHETIPFLCALSASAMVRFADSPSGAGRVASGPGMAALGLAIVSVNLTMFLPDKVDDLRLAADAQNTLPRMEASRNLHDAVVFYDQFAVSPASGFSWAYYPRVNSPGYDDDIIHLRYDRKRPSANLELWRRRFPGRSAWYFSWTRRTPVLVPLEEHVTRSAPSADKPRP